jgi:hypothetical protein
MKNAAQYREPRPIAGWVLALLSLAVGLVAGFGAVVFRDLIGGFHNLLFFGRFSFYYDANIHTAPSPWGAWVILAPVLGAVGVACLVKTFTPEAKGHGVPKWNLYAIKMAAVFMISTSTLAMRTGFTPRWIAFLGFACALLLLLSGRYIGWILGRDSTACRCQGVPSAARSRVSPTH